MLEQPRFAERIIILFQINAKIDWGLGSCGEVKHHAPLVSVDDGVDRLPFDLARCGGHDDIDVAALRKFAEPPATEIHDIFDHALGSRLPGMPLVPALVATTRASEAG